VLKYNSRKVDNSANDCNCRFRTEMATKRKNAGLQLKVLHFEPTTQYSTQKIIDYCPEKH